VQGHDCVFIHLLYNRPIRKRYDNYKESLWLHVLCAETCWSIYNVWIKHLVHIKLVLQTNYDTTYGTYNITKHIMHVRKVVKSNISFTTFTTFVVSAHPHGTVRLPLDGFLWNVFGGGCVFIIMKIHVWLNSDKNNTHCTWLPAHITDYFGCRRH